MKEEKCGVEALEANAATRTPSDFQTARFIRFSLRRPHSGEGNRENSAHRPWADPNLREQAAGSSPGGTSRSVVLATAPGPGRARETSRQEIPFPST